MSEQDGGYGRMAAFFEAWTRCLNVLGALAATRALTRWRQGSTDDEILATVLDEALRCLDVARRSGEWPAQRDDAIACSLREIDALATSLVSAPPDQPSLFDIQGAARRCLRAAGLPEPEEGWDAWEPDIEDSVKEGNDGAE